MTGIIIADMTMRMVTAMAPVFRFKTVPVGGAEADIIIVIKKKGKKKILDFYIKIAYYGKSINAVKETLAREHDRNMASPTESAVCGNGNGNTLEQII